MSNSAFSALQVILFDCTNLYSYSMGNITLTGQNYLSSGTSRIDSTSLFASANVGIGTTSPQYSLDVSGNINFTGGLYKNGTLFYGYTGYTGYTGPGAGGTGDISLFTFSSQTSTTNNDYIGQSYNSSTIQYCQVVVPLSGNITTLAFNIRGQTTTSITTATFNKNGINTSLIASIPIGLSNAIATGSISVIAGDLITIQVNNGFSLGCTISCVFEKA